MELFTFRPKTNKVKLDIMFGDKWGGQVLFPCTPGVEYTDDELKAFARMKRPSLIGKDFCVLPCDKPKFR